MALAITITDLGGAHDVVSMLKAGTLRIRQSVDGSQGTCDLVLLSPTGIDYSVNRTITVTDGATTYFNGTIRQYRNVAVTASSFEAVLSCQDDSPVSAATSAASFGLSDTPNGTTTFGYDHLELMRDATGTGGGSTLGAKCSTWKAGLAVGQTVALTNGLGTVFRAGLGTNPRIVRMTITWPTSKLSAPRFDLEFEATGTALVRTQAVPDSAFPVGARPNQAVFRTDLGLEFYFDGTRWLSTELFRADIPSLLNVSATTSAQGSAIASEGTDIWLVKRVTAANVASGGTALGASHNWAGTLRKVDVNGAETVLDTYTINSGASGVWRKQTTALGVLVTAGSFYILKDIWTKTGTPGNFTMSEYVTYRVVST